MVIRRCTLFLSLYRPWLAEQDDRNILPPWNEILRQDPVVDLLLRPNNIEVTVKDFQPLREQFSVLAAQWREHRVSELRELVLASPEFTGKVPEAVDPLSLAAVVFDCDGCIRSLGYMHMLPPLYPAILAHRCLCRPQQEIEDSEDPLCRAIAAIASVGGHPTCHQRWETRRLSIGKLHKRAVAVIKACGKDPLTTTRAEMDGLDVRFWCETCDENAKGEERAVMRWRDTVGVASMHMIFLPKHF